MRLSTTAELMDLLDEVPSRRSTVDRTSRAAGEGWAQMLAQEGHPLNTDLPDEPLVDWHDRDLLGDLSGRRVLDVGRGNGRNAAWLAGRGASVVGVDLSAGLLDSGCFHHLAPHRRVTYLERVLPLMAPGGLFGIVAFAEEEQPCASDAEILSEGGSTGGTSFTREDLRTIFGALQPVEIRQVREDVEGTFGAGFLNTGLFRAV